MVGDIEDFNSLRIFPLFVSSFAPSSSSPPCFFMMLDRGCLSKKSSSRVGVGVSMVLGSKCGLRLWDVSSCILDVL